MKNLKVSLKLMVSFFIVIALALIIGFAGILGMVQINGKLKDMYQSQTKPLPEIGKAGEYLQRLRVQARNAILYTGDIDEVTRVEGDIKDRETKFLGFMEEYRKTMFSDTAIKLYDESMKEFKEVFMPGLNDMVRGAKAGMDQSELMEMLSVTGSSVDKIVANVDEMVEIKIAASSAANAAAESLFKRLFIIIILVIIAAIAVALFLARYITGLIVKPLDVLGGFMQKAGDKGDIKLTSEEVKLFQEYEQVRDELGACLKSTQSFINHILDVNEMLSKIAGGDLTVKVYVMSEKDAMGISLKHVVDSLNSMFVEINNASQQVTLGSSQVADGAHMLASGATEQAATLQQISASISDISERTKSNASKTSHASQLAGTIMRNAEKGSGQMEQMIAAVNDINHANQSISKVIKAIDDIAFQTNILALNAAVEAARAGAAGKGFAVVAEEVRNLAAKSAESAKETSGIIANSVEKAQLGTHIAGETAASLHDIVSGITESNAIINEIAQSSDEQTSAIGQINIAVGEVTQVVQQNSATAEQSAAASEEMSGQASLLEGLIAKFKLQNKMG